MSSVAERTVVRLHVAPNSLRLVCWPLRDEPLRSGLVIALIAMISAISGLVAGRWITAVILFALLNLTVIGLWLPIMYEIGSKGIVYSWIGRRRRVAWSEVARYELLSDGVILYGDHQARPFGSLRAVFIRWNGRRDELLPLIEFYLTSDPIAPISSTQSFQPST